MPIAKITGQGLAAIACSVALLWACLVGERVTVRHARREHARVIRDLHFMQTHRRVEPVSIPVPVTPRGVRVG